MLSGLYASARINNANPRTHYVFGTWERGTRRTAQEKRKIKENSLLNESAKVGDMRKRERKGVIDEDLY